MKKQVDLGFQHDVKEAYPDHRALFTAGEHVQALIAHPGWAAVMDLLDGRISGVDGKLDGSKPLSHVEYAHGHGERRGLIAAREAAYTLEAVYVDELRRQQEKHEAGAEPLAER